VERGSPGESASTKFRGAVVGAAIGAVASLFGESTADAIQAGQIVTAIGAVAVAALVGCAIAFALVTAPTRSADRDGHPR
jgi:hypothetical protein